MELSYYETIESEIINLKDIVNNVFDIDLSKITSERKLVDARRIYSKVLRERGYTFEIISKSLKKNHATVIHYMKSIDSILLYDKDLREKYLTCKNLFLEGKSPILIERRKKDVDLFMTIVKLNAELQEAISEKKEILTKFVDYIEHYEYTTGNLPSIKEYRRSILPKFNN